MTRETFPQIRRLEYEGKSLGEIPPEPNRAYYELDPNVRLIWVLGRLFSLVWTFFGLVVLYMVIRMSAPDWEPVAFYGGWALLTPSFVSVFWPLISYRYWGVAIRASDLVVRWGVLWKRVMCIPFARIQHVDTQAGPLERAFGVANLAVFTAGSRLGVVSIPGLPDDLAVQLRDFLSQVGQKHANL
ncbi:MAG: PH domain-containing protein [Acidobacteria bacterium]|nr:PH domain-containing protein [Acidobacteriota bacterium]